MRKKRIIMALSLILATESVANPVAANAIISTSAGHSINNDTPGIDYKLNEDEQNDVLSKLKYGYLSNVDADESKKYVSKGTDRIIEDSSKESDRDSEHSKEYLIKHNLLEQKRVLKWNGKTFTTVSYEDARKEWDKTFNTLYKSVYESIPDEGTSASVASSTFSGFIAQIIDGNFLSNAVSTSSTKETAKAIEANLKRRRSTFKKSVAGKSRLKVVEKFQAAMESLKKYAKGFKPLSLAGDDDYVIKTELMPLLYKAAWGAQKSRPIIFKQKSIRNAKKYSKTTAEYWNGGKAKDYVVNYWDGAGFTGDADFSKGDFYYFISSNVNELYYKELVDKGLLRLKDFQNENKKSAAGKFRKAYQTCKKGGRATWSAGNGLCSTGVEDSLGATMETSKTKMTYKDVTFFEDEDLSCMDIYKWVEKFLRQSEKDVSKKEANIITYKYGLKYLQVYQGSELSTLKFLIAKGILNFEDESQFQGLDSPMTYSRLYQLLYRVACKNARYDFSQVTLTDGESYWMKKGYGETSIPINELRSDFIIDSGKAVEIKNDEETVASTGLIGSLLSSFAVHAKAESKKDFNVTFKLSKDTEWCYNNVPVSSLESGDKSIAGVTVKSTNITHDGKKIQVYKITIKLKASTASGAVKLARLKLTNKAGQKSSVEAVASVKSNSTEYTMISQAALKKSLSNISILEDKVLLNTSTGTQAVLFADLGYAMVGNTIVKTSGLVCQNAGSEVFYNLKIIVSLLDDTFLQKIGASTGIFKIPKKLKPYSVGVETEYDPKNSNVTCATMKVTNGMMKSADSEEYSKGDAVYYYKLNDLTDGVNTMMRQYKIKLNGTTATMYLVVDWQFAIPSVDDYASKDVLKAFSQKKNLTQAQVTKWLYTRPTKSKTLTAWWDSNYAASNALINFMCDTDKVNYVTSGWMAPSISILMPDKKTFKQKSDEWISQLFKGISICSYKGGTTTDGSALAGYFGSGNDWSMWHTTFYSPSVAFNTVDDEADSALLERMCSTYRTKSVYYGDSVKTYGGYSYGMNYFITKAGVVYRNLKEDSRVSYSTKKSKISKVVVTTRSEINKKPKADSTIITYKRGGRKHTFLYRGVSAGGRIKLTPIDKPIRANVATKSGRVNKLYNGCFFAADDSGTTIAVDRGDKASALLSKDYRTGTSCASSAKANSSGLDGFCRFSSWKSLYKAWAEEYLGSGVTDGSGLKYYSAFNFNKACIKAAEREGVDFGSLDSFVSLSKKTAGKLNKSYTVMINFASAIKFAKDGVSVTPGSSNSGFIGSGAPSAAQGFFNWHGYGSLGIVQTGSTGIVLNPLDSTKNGIKYVIGNRVSHSVKELRDEKYFRPAWLKEENNGSLKEPATIEKQYAVFAVPQFFLPGGDWSISVDSSGKGTLVKHGEVPAINFANYYYSGMLKGIQETIIAKYVKTLNLSEVAPGSALSIGGIRFYIDSKKLQDKNGVWMTSVCLRPQSARKPLLDTAAKWSNKLTTQVAYKTQVKNLFKDIMIKCDGVFYPITNYIVDKTKEGQKSGIQVGGLSTSAMAKKYGLVYCKANKIYGYKKGKSSLIKKSSKSYSLVRVRVKLNRQLKVRPLNDEGNRFALAQTTVNGNIGTDDDALMYYQEDLSYDDKQTPSIGIENIKFNPSAAFNDAKKQFMRMYSEAFAGDLRVLVLAIICSISIYLSVISWIAYLVLHYGVMDTIFRVLAQGYGRARGTGFDAVKFFSLGIYSLDDDPPLYRIVIIQFICAVIAAVCVNMVGR